MGGGGGDHRSRFISASNDHFCARGLGRISRKIKIAVKSIRTTGPQLPLFMRSVKIAATFKVAMLSALADAQCETRELPQGNEQ